MKITTLTLFLFSAFTFLPFQSKAQAGSLDLSFGTNGLVTTAVGTDDDDVHDLAIQADDKIVVVGFTEEGANADMMMVRYEANGALDLTFGTNGKVVTTFGAGDEEAHAVAIQADGKIVVVGRAHSGVQQQIAVARYLYKRNP